MTEASWSSVVALVSVIISGASAIFASWDKNRSDIELNNVKLKYEKLEKEGQQLWSTRLTYCNQITDAAKSLANSYATFRTDPSVTNASTNNANLWAGATLLRSDDITKVMTAIDKGASADDATRFKLTNELVDMTLRGLVASARDCRQNLRLDNVALG